MKPLICFYSDNLFLYSQTYELKFCATNENIFEFLGAIEREFSSVMKVLQLNFESDHEALFQNQKELYPSDKATVFLLQDYEILSLDEILKRTVGERKPTHFAFAPLEEKSSFTDKVTSIKKQIAEGRLYQINLTAPLVSACSNNGLEVFESLHSKFNGEYKTLLPLRSYDLISFSPELFLQKTKNSLITRPIKGSLPENLDFEEDLLANRKEEAELSMIVDLLRNDLNRIENTNSAQVRKHRAPLRLGYIQHTYSEIEIQTEKNLPAVLKATLPGGSISGCPKLESLLLIAEMEAYKRQAYTGVAGWWQNNEFCLNLSIRSFMKHQNSLYYHSGCGIVYDSEPEKEWQEFILKTGHLNKT